MEPSEIPPKSVTSEPDERADQLFVRRGAGESGATSQEFAADRSWERRLHDERQASRAPSVSAIVHTLNESESIVGVIRNLAWCDEVVVIDMHSDDTTAALARAAGARVVLCDRLGYVEPARNFGSAQAKGEWIFVVDADETIPESLARDLVAVTMEDSADVVAVPKVSSVSDQWLKASGWGTEHHYRFFKRGYVHWNDEIHSVPDVKGRTLILPVNNNNQVQHATARDLSHFFQKLMKYSEFEPNTFEKQSVPFSWDLAVEDAQREFVRRWSVDEDGPLSAVLSFGLYFYKILSHAKYWERHGFPDVGAPIDPYQAMHELSGGRYEAMAEALRQSRGVERDVRALLAATQAKLDVALPRIEELDSLAEERESHTEELRSELLRLGKQYDELSFHWNLAVNSRGWRALERLRRVRDRSVKIKERLRVRTRTPGDDIGSAQVEPEPPVPSAASDSLRTLRFQTVADPVVSILVPAYNQARFTIRCLASIASTLCEAPYEVILVDDCSTDETPDALRQVDGLVYVRNEHNLGFVDAVNAGSASARGKYLLLLNNDTEVQEGWLDALVEAIESDDGIGAVGSKLVYPDGRLQEAGGIVWLDGSAWNFGRGDDPNAPQYCVRREVDYCSAASLLVKRDLFEKLGRFDKRFAPGYYEDTDLCFAMRAEGYRVLFEPRSVVVHHEGRTFGTDTDPIAEGRHTKASQHRNQALFLDKWRMALSRHYPNGTAQGFFGGRPDGRPRVLVVDAWVPADDQDSGSLRMTWILRLLTELGAAVTLFPVDGNPREPYTSRFQDAGVEVWYSPWTFADLATSRAGLYDLVLVSRAPVATEYLSDARKAFPRAAIVFDTVDLHFVRERRRLDVVGVGDSEGILARQEEELRSVRQSTVTAAITAEEGDLISSLVPDARVVVLPNVHPVVKEIPPFGERRDLLFIGGFAHDPNVDAVRHLIEEILPRVLKTMPLRLWVVGSNPPEELWSRASSEVIITGHLVDVAEYFRMARVFVAPLRYGAGMKGKIGHALSLGLPVVTSTIGAEGMGLVDGQHALIRDDPDGFSDAVIRLYRGETEWNTLSKAGIDLAEKDWSPAVMKERLDRLLHQVGCLPR